MSTLIRYLLLVFWLLLAARSGAQMRIPFAFKQYNTTNGLCDNKVYAVVQDSKKYLWFCTPSGVNRFDGRTFQYFNIAQGLSDNEVLGAIEDDQQRLWFNTFNGKPCYFDLRNETMHNYHNDTVLAKGNVSSFLDAVVPDKYGNIWLFGEHYQLKKIDPKGNVWNVPLGSVYTFYICANEQKEIICLGDTVKKLDYATEQWVAQPKAILAKVQQRHAVLRSTALDGTAYFAIDSVGIVVYRNNRLERLIAAEAYQNRFVLGLSIDKAKQIWIGVEDGVFRCNSQDLTQKPKFIYTGVTVTGGFIDHEGNTWLSTMGQGAFLLPSQYDNIEHRNQANGLPTNQVTAITDDGQGGVVFATSANTLHWKNANGQLRKIALISKKMLKINILHLYTYEQDLWIMVNNSRLFRLPDLLRDARNPPQRVVLTNAQTIPKSSLRGKVLLLAYPSFPSPFKNMFRAKNGTYYFGSSALSRVVISKKNQTAEYRQYSAGDRSRIYALAEDEGNKIWFGGAGGLGFFDPQRDTTEMLNLNFETTINAIVCLPNGYKLVGTAGNGVYLVKYKQIVQHWTTADGLSSDACTRLLMQDPQNVWLATVKGVTLMQFEGNDYSTMKARIYGSNDDKLSLQVNDLCLQNQVLSLATNDGLYAFNIRKLVPQNTRPILYLTSPNVFIRNPDTTFTLSATWTTYQKEVKFTFQTIALLNGESVEYRYQLYNSGVLEKSDSTRTNDVWTLSFLALTPGDYELEVSSSRRDGIWSAPVRAKFKVSPPLLRQNWALTLYALLLVIGTYNISSYRTRRQRARQMRIMQAQTERLRFESLANQARQRQLELEQETIRARIDPHFVFNSLNGMMSFVYQKNFEGIKQHLPRLARTIRASLQLGSQEWIDVNTETNYLNDYLALEQMRFEGKFEYRIQVAEGVPMQAKILPPLLLQIFVENAVRHGIMSLPTTEKGILNIDFSVENTESDATQSELVCRVRDNGIGIKASLAQKKSSTTADPMHQSIGVQLAQKRIELLRSIYNRAYSLDISDRNDGQRGTIVTLRLPLVEV